LNNIFYENIFRKGKIQKKVFSFLRAEIQEYYDEKDFTKSVPKEVEELLRVFTLNLNHRYVVYIK
jgi:predicted HTH transcriptional regulator